MGDAQRESTDGGPRFVKFTGEKAAQWFPFRENARAQLFFHKLLDYAEVPEPVAEDAKYAAPQGAEPDEIAQKHLEFETARAAWRAAQRSIYFRLVTFTEGEAKSLVLQHKDQGYDAWSALRERYEKSGEMEKARLRRKYQQPDWSPTASPCKLFLEMETGQRALLDLGEETPDHVLLGKAMTLLMTIPAYKGIMDILKWR